MRPTFLFWMPTLRLSFVVYILSSQLMALPWLSGSSHAQVTPITPSGLNTQVNLSQAPPAGKVQYDITGGTRAGANLFHSFGDFGVPTNNIANLLNNTGLQTSNILSRVTGGNPSNIFGTIQTTGFGSANLFLMNPAGIVFGPNASLNVGGSVSFMTADYLRFADGTRFNAIPGPTDASLSSAPVAAYGFLGSNPGAISVQGSQLSVSAGAELALIGENITIQSATLDNATTQAALLSAPGGKISLASAASAGEILAGSLEQTANVNGQSFGAQGAIQIAEKSVIDVSGDGGGTVVIRGGRFLLDDSLISANVTGPGSGSPGAGIDIAVSQDAVIQNGATLETNVSGNATPGVQYGGVTVKADHIEVRGIADFDTGNFVFTNVQSSVAPDSTGGNSGDITLEANSILVKDAGQIQSVTNGAGNASNIRASADQNLEIQTGIVQSAAQFATGDAGNIELSSAHGNISLKDRSNITTQVVESPGTAGNIRLSALSGDIILSDAIFFSYLQPPVNVDGVRAVRAGGSGAVQINGNNLQMNGGDIGVINLSTLPPGDVALTLSGNLSLRSGSLIPNSSIHASSNGSAPSAGLAIRGQNVLITEGSSLSTETVSSGAGGPLNISADTVQLSNGGAIRSGSTQGFDPNTGLRVTIPTSGPAGTVTIQGLASPARSVLIDGAGSGIFTNTEGTGAGGNTVLSARTLTIQNDGTISASSSGIAPSAIGGSISITTTDQATMTSGAAITASSTGPANAGNIAINAGAQFLSNNASVTTEATQASGGNIFIQATDSIRLINSQLSTSVQGGPNTSGGNITLDPAVVTLQNSQVLAQAVQGSGGNINIIAGTFLADPTSVVSASSQFGLSGSVNIQSPLSNLSGSLATLPQRPLQSQPLLQQRCAAQANGQLSSLVVAGRDTLPYEPGGWLMSSMALLSEDVPVSQPPLISADIVPSPQRMIVSGQIYERHTPSPQQGVASWAAGCGS